MRQTIRLTTPHNANEPASGEEQLNYSEGGERERGGERGEVGAREKRGRGRQRADQGREEVQDCASGDGERGEERDGVQRIHCHMVEPCQTTHYHMTTGNDVIITSLNISPTHSSAPVGRGKVLSW